MALQFQWRTFLQALCTVMWKWSVQLFNRWVLMLPFGWGIVQETLILIHYCITFYMDLMFTKLGALRSSKKWTEIYGPDSYWAPEVAMRICRCTCCLHSINPSNFMKKKFYSSHNSTMLLKFIIEIYLFDSDSIVSDYLAKCLDQWSDFHGECTPLLTRPPGI